MRLARYLVCTTAIIVGLGAANVTIATADAPTHSEPFVTCATPIIVDGNVEVSSARAERGTTLTPSVPGETCTLTP